MAKTKKKVDEYTIAYMDYYPLVYSTVYSKVGNKEDANDICQEMFIIFYEKFDEIENKRKWLFGTMRNLVLRYYQSKDNSKVNIDDVFDDVSVTFVNGFRDTRIIISEAIENLECNEEERIIIDLIATHNFSYNHVAKLTGLSRRQVEYKYGQLVKRIMSYLQEKGIKDIGELL